MGQKETRHGTTRDQTWDSERQLRHGDKKKQEMEQKEARHGTARNKTAAWDSERQLRHRDRKKQDGGMGQRETTKAQRQKETRPRTKKKPRHGTQRNETMGQKETRHGTKKKQDMGQKETKLWDRKKQDMGQKETKLWDKKKQNYGTERNKTWGKKKQNYGTERNKTNMEQHETRHGTARKNTETAWDSGETTYGDSKKQDVEQQPDRTRDIKRQDRGHPGLMNGATKLLCVRASGPPSD